MSRTDERGAAAVEFAVVLPVLVLLLFATIQFGLAFFEFQGLQAAAREGARLASYSGSPQWSEVVTRVNDAAAEIQGGAIVVELEQDGTAVALSDSARACDGTVSEIRLRARYTDDYEIDAVFFNASVPMAAQAVFRCEVGP